MAALLRIRSLKKRVSLFAYLFVACFSIAGFSIFVAFPVPAFANTTSTSLSNGPINTGQVNIGQTIPFEQLQNRQYTIEVNINDIGPLKFMIDTAATRTSIFNKTWLRLGLVENPAEKFVTGLTSSDYRPTSNVETLSFGRQVFYDHNIIILEDWDNSQFEDFDGVLGMDVLNHLVLAFSHKSSTVNIGKNSRYSKSKYRRWKKIRLEDNPYPVRKFGLLFTYTQLGDLHIPTLLDTGANFSAINWMSVKGTSIAKERRRLHEEWVIQGSIGEFKPKLRVRLEQTYIGGVKLKQHEFLVMNFDNFPINNYGAYPLVITGIDLFDGRDFTLDFITNHIYIAPKARKLRIGLWPSRIKNKVDE